jgi:DNA-binding NtrC family response regulator
MADTKAHVLLVEDEVALRVAVADQLADAGYHVVQAHSGEEAVHALSQFAFDVVVTDLRLPGIGGTEVLEAAVERYADIVVIVMTGFGTVRDAVATIKRGASDFITKPFQTDELLHVLTAALEQRRLRSENAYLRSQLEARYRFDGIIGQSPAMRAVFEVLQTVASAPSTILLTGETGTGKELVARAIHHNSPRRDHRFVAINCAALPETLLEAELFGHVRGAFTGAVGPRTGRLEQAHRGTLFLDEVGTMSPGVQTKLLRVLQEREFERLGESHPTRIDVRLIAATNSDLVKMVKDGTFREDLFYRLNVIPVHMPALRERREDIPVLAQHFLDRVGRDLEPPRTGVSFSQEAMRRLMAFDWPGNVRQLENAVERALTLGGGRTQIDVSMLPVEIQSTGFAVGPVPMLPEQGIDLDAYVADLERDLIAQSLERSGGNKRRAAALLGLKRTTLVEKLKRVERQKTTG